MKKTNYLKSRISNDGIGLTVFSVIILLTFALATFIPFWNVVCKAFSADWAVISGKVTLLPIGFQLKTIKTVLTGAKFINSFKMSVIITVLGSLISFFITALVAYPLSKKHLKGMKIILMLLVFTMLFNGGLIPTYLVIKKLNLNNTIWALILPNALSVYNMLIIKNYYENLPASIEESATIDGAGNLTVFFRIIAPLSKPVYATILLFVTVALWNDYYNPMIYIMSENLRPLPLYLNEILVELAETEKTGENSVRSISEGVRAATTIASAVPILIIYPFLQKYFVKGILIGSVKG